MRPRGESFSLPSWRYVGHAGRHKPQCTQVRSLSVFASRSEANSPRVSVSGDLMTALAIYKPKTNLPGFRSECWSKAALIDLINVVVDPTSPQESIARLTCHEAFSITTDPF